MAAAEVNFDDSVARRVHEGRATSSIYLQRHSSPTAAAAAAGSAARKHTHSANRQPDLIYWQWKLAYMSGRWQPLVGRSTRSYTTALV